MRTCTCWTRTPAPGAPRHLTAPHPRLEQVPLADHAVQSALAHAVAADTQTGSASADIHRSCDVSVTECDRLTQQPLIHVQGMRALYWATHGTSLAAATTRLVVQTSWHWTWPRLRPTLQQMSARRPTARGTLIPRSRPRSPGHMW
jgi:hypothetical protein